MALAILSRVREGFQENPWPAVIAPSIPVQKLLEAGRPPLVHTVCPVQSSACGVDGGCRPGAAARRGRFRKTDPVKERSRRGQGQVVTLYARCFSTLILQGIDNVSRVPPVRTLVRTDTMLPHLGTAGKADRPAAPRGQTPVRPSYFRPTPGPLQPATTTTLKLHSTRHIQQRDVSYPSLTTTLRSDRSSRRC
jgi:hypothetical protein